MTSFAVILQVYNLTRFSAAVGALGLVRVIPVLTLGLIGGSFADAVDRRAGVADTTSVVFRITIVQLATPDRFHGRVTSVDYVVGASGPQLGNFEAGLVAALTSPAISAVSGGVATVIGAAVLRLAMPGLARYSAPSSPPVRPAGPSAVPTQPGAPAAPSGPGAPAAGV